MSTVSPQHARHGSLRSIYSTSPRLQRIGTPISALGRSAYSMSPPLTGPTSKFGHAAGAPHAFGRTLPPRTLTESNIEDAYVRMIMYANPAIPDDIDTADLRRMFQAPPRSDGKLFKVFNIWEKVQKLDKKLLKTWSEVVTELGVEPPSVEKGQSTQKIQQYAVRLKRWLRAMHVDALFEYALGKPHGYWQDLPTTIDGDDIRDGVPAEEDLVLRSLLPKWKPKRGRKKAIEKGHDVHLNRSPKRLRLDTSTTSPQPEDLSRHPTALPQSAILWSAYPNDAEERPEWVMPQQASTGRAEVSQQAIQLRDEGVQNESYRRRRDRPPQAYPSSAHTFGHHVPDGTQVRDEPQSAIIPSTEGGKSRSRRRRGPAVSSAWLGNSTSAGKQRGRPPSNRLVQDGPFSTFPAKIQEASDISNLSAIPPVSRRVHSNAHAEPNPMPAGDASHESRISSPLSSVRPGKLQLQVPPRAGPPVRLATPPTLTLNGGEHSPNPPIFSSLNRPRRNSADFFRNPEDRPEYAMPPETSTNTKDAGFGADAVFDYTLEDVCNTFAAHLMAAKLIGRSLGLSIEEAKAIASKVVESLCRGACAKSTAEALLAMRCAILLGLETEMGLPGTSPKDRCLTIRATLKHHSRPHSDPAQSQTRAYDYTISIDSRPGDLLSAHLEIRNIVVAEDVASEAVQRDFEGLREYLKEFANGEGPDNEEHVGVDGKSKIELKKELEAKAAQLRLLRRTMLEVVLGQ